MGRIELDVAPQFQQRLHVLAEYETHLKLLLQFSTEYGAVGGVKLAQPQQSDLVCFADAAKNATIELQSYQEAVLHWAKSTPSHRVARSSKLLALVPQAERARAELAKAKVGAAQ